MGRRGMTVALRYVQVFRDHNGHMRHYYRQPGKPRAALPGKPGSPEFMEAYHAAAAGQKPPEKPTSVTAAPGTFDRLLSDYFRSPAFLKTRGSSQSVTRGILERFAAAHGRRLVSQMEGKHVIKIMSGMAETPAAANNLLKKLRALFKFAKLAGYRKDDPTWGLERYAEGTHHTWTDHELMQFETRWPLGTRQRTAFALALYTGQRRADLVAMTWRAINEQAGTIKVIQEKTRAKLDVPIHPALKDVLAAWPRDNITILATSGGRGTSVAGFGNFMADAIGAAGLPDMCVLHGLRKAAARRLAEAGCTTLEIMSITGHRSLEEIERYTRDANQGRMAKSAIGKLARLSTPLRNS